MNEDERNTSMQFCQECNNLMYPREVLDRDNPQDSRLVYTCKSPNCIEKGRPRRECKDAESTLVWKHVVQHSMKVDDLINADIVNDPTLPRTQQVHCPECKANDAVYLQTSSGAQQGISLCFVCCDCNHMWKDTAAVGLAKD